MSKPRLLLHTCCAPCLTAVDERLRDLYDVDLFWYNPNIHPQEEFERRLNELVRFAGIIGRTMLVPDEAQITRLPPGDLLEHMPAAFDRQAWQDTVISFANEPEGKRRCGSCIGFRLEKTARFAKEEGYDLFATTLSVSPHKNAALINSLGTQLANKYDVAFLEADFKKENGYLRSVELSRRYALYRQTYCGCVYSLRESLVRASKKQAGATLKESRPAVG